jgi:hypothetical protein
MSTITDIIDKKLEERILTIGKLKEIIKDIDDDTIVWSMAFQKINSKEDLITQRPMPFVQIVYQEGEYKSPDGRSAYASSIYFNLIPFNSEMMHLDGTTEKVLF